ncbi:EF-P 5-aminopentanol modification-associated protein YfmF [Cytobacillus sp. NCCP-133]|uniref:EF-P 5-aminopentanol modification-associated protein YfmF n=1 Tax=Cytobacillus sp. NCCP-133 TaxID=766848 RepID=UPI00223289E8|nr:pitrilysin family protein [Cytobacillus sp. NCCP-133]GLB59281.1 putative inactive metalloprotease YmfF [Cytobacillus sp. NCCP-133]
MDVISESVKAMKGFKLHVVKTEKYKTNTLVWKMKAPLNKETVTIRSLLPHVLQSNSASYPSTGKLRSSLDELYGATLFVDLAKKGEYHVITMSVEIANEKFLSDNTPLLKKAFQFLSEILTKPNVQGIAFEKETVAKEKRTLKQRIQSVYDDKMRYSNFRLVQEMCKGEPYELHVHGDKEDVDPITPESLYQYYQTALSEDELDLYVIGDVNEADAESYAGELLSFEERTPKTSEPRPGSSKNDVNEVREEQDVKQGKLNIGYRTNVVYGDPDYYALQVFNGIFGGFSHSKLFLNVREKASLAYYVASRLESHKGLMMVMSGIDNKNYDQAVNIIKEQLEAMKNGDFTEQEIDQTQAVIKNQLLETVDTARGIVEVLYHNVVSGKDITLQTWMEEMDKVTSEEIAEVAKKVSLDTVYFLTGKEAGK